jgi:UDP-3-O-[3-hydroxymyristoyl] glucosamine N-acyltransferase
MKYARQILESQAGLIIVPANAKLTPPEGRALIFLDVPDVGFTQIVAFFAPEPIRYEPGVHPTAVIASSARIGNGVHIGANAVIEAEATVGDRSVIAAGCYVGHFTSIGEDCLIYPNVSIRERCRIGNRVIIHLGAAIGADGFGFAPGPTGITKIPQVGTVQIDDDVEIGALAAVDRARFGKTWIKRGVKIDDLVMIAHNVEIGEFSILAGQGGIAGSAVLGRGVIMGAQAGINGHIHIGDGVRIAGTSGVPRDWPAGGIAAGTPAETPDGLRERLAAPRKVRRLEKRIEEMEQQLAALREKLG